MPPPSADGAAARLELALEHAGWLRALARRLVADAWIADDCVQETWVRALASPPPPGARLRPWLAAVLRNLARSDSRARTRRSQREALGPAPAHAPPAADVAAELALSRELLAAVEALPEPYRAMVVARYYRGESAAAVARRAGVPEKTVETRLSRALALLRERLDRQAGGRGRDAWLGALLPWFGRTEILPVAVGALIMETKVKIVLAAALLAGGALVLAPRLGDRVAVPSAAPTDQPSDAALAAAVELQAQGLAVDDRAAVPPPAPAGLAADVPVEPAVLRSFVGRVEDLEGSPVGGLGLWFHPGHTHEDAAATSIEPRAQSGPDGRFRFPEADEFGWIEARAPGWVTVLSPAVVLRALPPDAPEPLVIVAPEQSISGIVVGEDGTPIAGASVGLTVVQALRRELGREIGQAEELGWTAQSAADGRFEIPRAPEATGVVSAAAIGYEPVFMRLPKMAPAEVVLVLARPQAGHATVRGEVIDERGRPIDGAVVALGIDSQRTGADGSFAFDVQRRDGEDLVEIEPGVLQLERLREGLRAVAFGRLPAAHPLPGFEDLASADPRDLFFTLVLDRAALAIRGRVLEPDGSPVASAFVAISRSTHFGRELRVMGSASFSMDQSAESIMSGRQGSAGVLTDADGRFELGGLLEQSYEIVALEFGTLRKALTGPVVAGAEDVELRLPGPESLGRIAGRLMSARGTPIADANLIAGRDLGADVGPLLSRGFHTDDQGRFELEAACLEDLVLQIADPRLMPTVDYRLAESDDPEALEIRVALRCSLQVDLADSNVGADAFSLLDERGEPLEILLSLGGAFAMVGDVEIRDGRSEVVVVPETAATLVLRSKGVETARVAIVPLAGELAIVRP